MKFLGTYTRREDGEVRPKLLRGEARKVDVRLPGKGNSNSRAARQVHLIISMIKWIRTSRLSIKNSLSCVERTWAGMPAVVLNQNPRKKPF